MVLATSLSRPITPYVRITETEESDTELFVPIHGIEEEIDEDYNINNNNNNNNINNNNYVDPDSPVK